MYVGNQQFKGNGVQRSCDYCLQHRAYGEGWARGRRGMKCPACITNKEGIKL